MADRVEAVVPPGLLAVAKLAIEEARKALSKVDKASLLRDSPLFDAVESLRESQLAVVAELIARDDDERPEPTAAERADNRQRFVLSAEELEAATRAVLAAVRAERERCAQIVEEYEGTTPTPKGVRDMIERIRTVT